MSTTLPFSNSTVAGYKVRTTPESDVVTSATNSIQTPVLNEDISGKLLTVGVNIMTAFSATCTFKLQGSYSTTGVFVDIATMDATLSSSVGVQTFTVDLSKVEVPYYRFIINDGGASIGTSGTLEIFYAYKE